MTGAQIITRIRTILRDVQTAIQKGEYWKTADILLFVNEAQLRMMNFLVKGHKRGQLQRLIATQTGTFTAANLVTTAIALPTNPRYFHYLSADVLPDGESIPRTARIYIGGKAVPYFDVRHYAVTVYRDSWYLSALGNPFTGTARLHYYRYPTAIANNGTTLADFGDDVYDSIVNLAVAMLGQKEVHMQRDIFKVISANSQIIEGESHYNFIPIKEDFDDWGRHNENAQGAP